jgi:penicillin-binding protein 1A
MPDKNASTRRTAKKKNKKKLSFSRVSLLAVLLIGIVLLFVGCGYVAGAVYSMPEWDPQKLEGSETTIIYDQEGQPVSRLYAEENRTAISLNDLPQEGIHSTSSIALRASSRKPSIEANHCSVAL